MTVILDTQDTQLSEAIATLEATLSKPIPQEHAISAALTVLSTPNDVLGAVRETVAIAMLNAPEDEHPAIAYARAGAAIVGKLAEEGADTPEAVQGAKDLYWAVMLVDGLNVGALKLEGE